MIQEDLKQIGWIMIYEKEGHRVYSHPDINTGYPFTEAEAIKKQTPNNIGDGK